MIHVSKRDELITAANEVRKNAYVPYSHYRVGAAILVPSGQIFTGVNIENAAYPMTICAERVAAFKAISEGETQFIAIAIVTNNGGFPCGACRQVLAEFNPDMVVFICDGDKNIKRETVIHELLPDSFGSMDLR